MPCRFGDRVSLMLAASEDAQPSRRTIVEVTVARWTLTWVLVETTVHVDVSWAFNAAPRAPTHRHRLADSRRLDDGFEHGGYGRRRALLLRRDDARPAVGAVALGLVPVRAVGRVLGAAVGAGAAGRVLGRRDLAVRAVAVGRRAVAGRVGGGLGGRGLGLVGRLGRRGLDRGRGDRDGARASRGVGRRGGRGGRGDVGGRRGRAGDGPGGEDDLRRRRSELRDQRCAIAWPDAPGPRTRRERWSAWWWRRSRAVGVKCAAAGARCGACQKRSLRKRQRVRGASKTRRNELESSESSRRTRTSR